MVESAVIVKKIILRLEVETLVLGFPELKRVFLENVILYKKLL